MSMYAPAPDQRHDTPSEDEKVRASGPRERYRGPARHADVGARKRAGRDPDDASHEVEDDDADRDDDERDEKPAAHELKHRQREEIEAYVAAEDRMRRAERDLIDAAEQHALPV